MNYLHMELKVCEGCGALWLRAGVLSMGVYCRRCAAELAQFPAARGRRSPSRMRADGTLMLRVSRCCRRHL